MRSPPKAGHTTRLVTCRGARYVGTGRAVRAVGKKLGAIEVSSDRETEDRDTLFPNDNPTGTGLYVIPGADPGKAIALEIAPGSYIRADRTKR